MPSTGCWRKWPSRRRATASLCSATWSTAGRNRWPYSGVCAQRRAKEHLELLGLADVGGLLSRNLSHGDQKLLDIGLALALEPKVLLLDEPTAGMGPEERWAMIEKVQALWRLGGMTLVFIEHDMDIVFKIAQTVRVLRYGAVLAEGTPDDIRANEAVIDAYLGTDHQLSAAVGEA